MWIDRFPRFSTHDWGANDVKRVLKAESVDSVLENDVAQHCGLDELTPAEAIMEITNTLVKQQAYCKRQKFDFLAYLIEMALLEATETKMRLETDELEPRS